MLYTVGMEGTVGQRDAETIDLRQQAHYWRKQHARAVEREQRWKQRAREAEKRVQELEAQVATLTAQ